MSGCWPYEPDTPHCGGHCTHVDESNRACVLEAHDGDVHLKATPPCDPNAAFKFARSPATGPVHNTVRGDSVVNDIATGHRWRWSYEYRSWEDLGPIPAHSIAVPVPTSVPSHAAAEPPRPPLRISGHITRLIPGGPDAPDRVFMEPDAGSDLRYVDGMHRTGADELIVPASIEGRQIGALVTCELSNEADPKLTRLTIVA